VVSKPQNLAFNVDTDAYWPSVAEGAPISELTINNLFHNLGVTNPVFSEWLLNNLDLWKNPSLVAACLKLFLPSYAFSSRHDLENDNNPFVRRFLSLGKQLGFSWVVHEIRSERNQGSALLFKQTIFLAIQELLGRKPTEQYHPYEQRDVGYNDSFAVHANPTSYFLLLIVATLLDMSGHKIKAQVVPSKTRRFAKSVTRRGLTSRAKNFLRKLSAKGGRLGRSKKNKAIQNGHHFSTLRLPFVQPKSRTFFKKRDFPK
jgi:hypothetical protein